MLCLSLIYADAPPIWRQQGSGCACEPSVGSLCVGDGTYHDSLDLLFGELEGVCAPEAFWEEVGVCCGLSRGGGGGCGGWGRGGLFAFLEELGERLDDVGGCGGVRVGLVL